MRELRGTCTSGLDQPKRWLVAAREEGSEKMGDCCYASSCSIVDSEIDRLC
jgi:hypothetical protein